MTTKCRSFTEIAPLIPPHITAVFLDLDNTLYAYEECHSAAIAAVAADCAKKIPHLSSFHERYRTAQQVVKSRIPTAAASHSRLLYFQNLLEEIASEHAITYAPVLEDIYWNTFLTTMKIGDGVIDFLAQCQARGTTVVVVSDLTTRIQCQKLTTLGITTYITHLVTSEEAGSDKPNAAPFLLALTKAGKQPHEVVMIGDSLEKDVHGAEALGIHAIHFTQ